MPSGTGVANEEPRLLSCVIRMLGYEGIKDVLLLDVPSAVRHVGKDSLAK
jgi:hypothetical protein